MILDVDAHRKLNSEPNVTFLSDIKGGRVDTVTEHDNPVSFVNTTTCTTSTAGGPCSISISDNNHLQTLTQSIDGSKTTSRQTSQNKSTSLSQQRWGAGILPFCVDNTHPSNPKILYILGQEQLNETTNNKGDINYNKPQQRKTTTKCCDTQDVQISMTSDAQHHINNTNYNSQQSATTNTMNSYKGHLWYGSGKWSAFEGGRKPQDRTPIDTAAREFCEETCCVIPINGMAPCTENITTAFKHDKKYAMVHAIRRESMKAHFSSTLYTVQINHVDALKIPLHFTMALKTLKRLAVLVDKLHFNSRSLVTPFRRIQCPNLVLPYDSFPSSLINSKNDVNVHERDTKNLSNTNNASECSHNATNVIMTAIGGFLVHGKYPQLPSHRQDLVNTLPDSKKTWEHQRNNADDCNLVDANDEYNTSNRDISKEMLNNNPNDDAINNENVGDDNHDNDHHNIIVLGSWKCNYNNTTTRSVDASLLKSSILSSTDEEQHGVDKSRAIINKDNCGVFLLTFANVPNSCRKTMTEANDNVQLITNHLSKTAYKNMYSEWAYQKTCLIEECISYMSKCGMNVPSYPSNTDKDTTFCNEPFPTRNDGCSVKTTLPDSHGYFTEFQSLLDCANEPLEITCPCITLSLTGWARLKNVNTSFLTEWKPIGEARINADCLEKTNVALWTGDEINHMIDNDQIRSGFAKLFPFINKQLQTAINNST